jgi:hypothetical protein
MQQAAGAGNRLDAAARATAERFGLDEMAGRLAALYATLGPRPA